MFKNELNLEKAACDVGQQVNESRKESSHRTLVVTEEQRWQDDWAYTALLKLPLYIGHVLIIKSSSYLRVLEGVRNLTVKDFDRIVSNERFK